MDKLKQYVTLTVLGCLVIAAAGWFLLVSPKRAEAAKVREAAAAQQSANAKLETQLQVLKAQAKELPKEQARLAKVAAKIPSTPELPTLIRSLVQAANGAGVELVEITPGTPAAVVDPTAAKAPAKRSGAKKATTESTKTSTTAKDRAAKAAAPVAAESPAGQLVSIPVTVNIAGGYFQAEQFVAALEDLPRALRVGSLVIEPGENPVKPKADKALVENGSSLTTTIQGTVFMAVNRPAATPVVVPGQKASTTGTPAK